MSTFAKYQLFVQGEENNVSNAITQLSDYFEEWTDFVDCDEESGYLTTAWWRSSVKNEANSEEIKRICTDNDVCISWKEFIPDYYGCGSYESDKDGLKDQLYFELPLSSLFLQSSNDSNNEVDEDIDPWEKPINCRDDSFNKLSDYISNKLVESYLDSDEPYLDVEELQSIMDGYEEISVGVFTDEILSDWINATWYVFY